MKLPVIFVLPWVVACSLLATNTSLAQDDVKDPIRAMQFAAVDTKQADWGHWGDKIETYSSWTNHSNRLIPVYTFGISLDKFTGENSVYRNAAALKNIYKRPTVLTVDSKAEYMDQTDIYRLQQAAFAAGKKHIVLIVFDGMDWQTTRAAAIYRNGEVTYTMGRGHGLAFQDYDQVETDFGAMATSPYDNSTKVDVDAQLVTQQGGKKFGGYNAQVGGYYPWSIPKSYPYLLAKDSNFPHAVTDSASSATSMTAGIKTYNGSINVDHNGKPVVPFARVLQEQGYKIGVVTSVPISHATPASAYSNNVTRNDYQDLTRDLLGQSSIGNRKPHPGVDVLIGCGFGVDITEDEKIIDEIKKQGSNFSPPNRFFAQDTLRAIDAAHGGKYQVVRRTAGVNGRELLNEATKMAVEDNTRLLGFFGTSDSHLPYATADGDYKPTRGIDSADVYTADDLNENPTLRDMTVSALTVLEQNEKSFWLMIEAGDVDWANHNNNIDDSIGAVYSGEQAFMAVCEWAEKNDRWKDTAVILTADHGHLFVMDRPEAFAVGKPDGK